jgi:DNA invertase Pin-like site-specific DNA recombinase
MIRVPHFFGYACGTSHGTRAEGAAAQKEAIEAYCQRIHRKLDGVFADVAASEDIALRDREAGGLLYTTAERADHIVVAKVDRLGGSFAEVARVLDNLTKRGVVLHVLDMDCVIDHANPHAESLVKFIVAVSKLGRQMIAKRTKQALAGRKAEGRRFARFAPWGFKWQRCGRMTVMVPVEREQEIQRVAAEMFDRGYPVDQVRQYLSYEAKVRNRNGRDFSNSDVEKMVRREAQLQRAKATTSTVRAADEIAQAPATSAG